MRLLRDQLGPESVEFLIEAFQNEFSSGDFTPESDPGRDIRPF